MDSIAGQSAREMDAHNGINGENVFLQSRVQVTSVSPRPFVGEGNEIDLSCILVKSISKESIKILETHEFDEINL